eukprot:Nk52_evm56s151 gene=Nk52_evmTU56s151
MLYTTHWDNCQAPEGSVQNGYDSHKNCFYWNVDINGGNYFTVPCRGVQEFYVQIWHGPGAGPSSGYIDAQATWIDHDGEWAINYVDKVDGVSVNCGGAGLDKKDIDMTIQGTQAHGGRFEYHARYVDQ